MTPFTVTEDDFIRTSKLDGLHAAEIAEHLCRSRDSVKARINRLNGNVHEAAEIRAEKRQRELETQREQVLQMVLAGNTVSVIRGALGVGSDLLASHIAVLRYEGRLAPPPKVLRKTTDAARLAVRSAPAMNVHSARVSLGNGANPVPRVTLPGVEPYEPLTNVSASRTCMSLEPGHDVYPNLKYCGEPSVDGKSFCTEHHFIFYRQPRPRAPVFV